MIASLIDCEVIKDAIVFDSSSGKCIGFAGATLAKSWMSHILKDLFTCDVDKSISYVGKILDAGLC